WAESQPGEGSTFCFTLPVESPQPLKHTPPIDSPRPDASTKPPAVDTAFEAAT
ncbi:MAG: hypothetical protein JWP63_4426, partial [Candidatus Solibacter sp.]|nr:hypothetical protein [Candidatus Solibacter sp.]